jgi:hypothetical protein
MTWRKKSGGSKPAGEVVADPRLIEVLRLFRSADDVRRAALIRMMERVATKQMTAEEAGAIFLLETSGSPPGVVAAARRQALKAIPGSKAS